MRNPHAVALGKLRKGIRERKSPSKTASARANLAKAREVRTAQLAAARAAEIDLSAVRGNFPFITDKLETIQ